jgi:hypothetical protein
VSPLYTPPTPRYEYTPADRNWLAWTANPDYDASTTALATSGTLYVFRALLPTASSITNIVYQVTALGTTLTSGQCLLGLATSAGVLIGQSADQSAIWASPGTTGVKTTALASGPFTATGPEVEIWALFNGTTGPTFPRGNGNAIINTGFTNPRFATANTGITALPTTRGALTALSVSYAFGLS